MMAEPLSLLAAVTSADYQDGEHNSEHDWDHAEIDSLHGYISTSIFGIKQCGVHVQYSLVSLMVPLGILKESRTETRPSKIIEEALK